MLYFCGFNGFHQFGSTHARRVLVPTALNLKEIFDEDEPECNQSDIKISPSWSYNAFAFKNEIFFTGFVNQKPNNVRKMRTVDKIKELISTDNFCLILLENGEVFKLNIHAFAMEKLNFANVENSARKRDIFGTYREAEAFNLNRIEHIACGTHICVAISKSNIVYNIPSKIFEFPKHVKIISLVSGFEHALALSSNGDVYAWGDGLRGQLGDEAMRIRRTPEIISALAGIKITSIAAAGWHSAAISVFGDVYLWGFNVNGQLGISIFKKIPDSEPQRNPTVYPLPQIANLPKHSCEFFHKIKSVGEHESMDVDDHVTVEKNSNEPEKQAETNKNMIMRLLDLAKKVVTESYKNKSDEVVLAREPLADSHDKENTPVNLTIEKAIEESEIAVVPIKMETDDIVSIEEEQQKVPETNGNTENNVDPQETKPETDDKTNTPPKSPEKESGALNLSKTEDQPIVKPNENVQTTTIEEPSNLLPAPDNNLSTTVEEPSNLLPAPDNNLSTTIEEPSNLPPAPDTNLSQDASEATPSVQVCETNTPENETESILTAETQYIEIVPLNLTTTDEDSSAQIAVQSDSDQNESSESNCTAIKVFCGSRNTIVQMKCGRYFATGWNENGQLGVNSKDNQKDRFMEIEGIPPNMHEIVCGPWCTIFRN